MRVARIKDLFWRWALRNEPAMPDFDPVAYRQLNVDVAAADLDPWVHYLRFGRAERRDPHADFSASGYLHICPEAVHWPDPWLHYLVKGREAGLAPLPELDGARRLNPVWPTLMLVGHQAGAQVYGAERSLLDIAKALVDFELNVVVVLPGAGNNDYVEELRGLCACLAILPYGWWRQGKAPQKSSVSNFRSLLQRYRVSALYANTSVLDEPLRAARELNLPVAVQVRELYDSDPDLCRLLNASPRALYQRLNEWANVVVANSHCTAQSLELDKALIVPNCLDPDAFSGLSRPSERGEPFTLGLISSNLPKKGLEDFVRLAGICLKRHPDWKFCLIGPDNCYIQGLRKRQKLGKVPANLHFFGYAATSQLALKEIDVLLNLSHFKESFGRTTLEAMAAGRPVVAYDWGALSELIVSGETGYLVPKGNIQAVAQVLAKLGRDLNLRNQLGSQGQSRARTHFSPRAQREALWQVVSALGIIGADYMR